MWRILRYLPHIAVRRCPRNAAGLVPSSRAESSHRIMTRLRGMEGQQVQTFFGRPFFRVEATLKILGDFSLATTKRCAF